MNTTVKYFCRGYFRQALILVIAVILTGCNYDQINEAGAGNTGSSNAITNAENGNSSVVEPEQPESQSGNNENTSVAEAENEEENNEEVTACDPCQSERTIDLQWLPESNVAGYRIYYGPQSDTVDQLLSDLNDSTPEFDPDAPAVSYHAWYDMGLFNGDSVCFAIETYDDQNNTELSESVCGVLNA